MVFWTSMSKTHRFLNSFFRNWWKHNMFLPFKVRYHQMSCIKQAPSIANSCKSCARSSKTDGFLWIRSRGKKKTVKLWFQAEIRFFPATIVKKWNMFHYGWFSPWGVTRRCCFYPGLAGARVLIRPPHIYIYIYIYTNNIYIYIYINQTQFEIDPKQARRWH